MIENVSFSAPTTEVLVPIPLHRFGALPRKIGRLLAIVPFAFGAIFCFLLLFVPQRALRAIPGSLPILRPLGFGLLCPGLFKLLKDRAQSFPTEVYSEHLLDLPPYLLAVAIPALPIDLPEASHQHS